MLSKYRNGLVPAASESELGARFADIGAQVHAHVMALRFREALDTVWELITALNREIDDRKPWELYKHERGAELEALLYDLCEGLRFIAILTFPFMPTKATEMWRQLGLADTPDVRWQTELRWGALAANTQTAPADALFPRLEPPAA
jgi:methionyl-tRNA synthetase